MMEDTLSKTAQAKKLLLEFWSDFQPHSVHEFRDYLKKNYNNYLEMNISKVNVYIINLEEK